MSSAIQKKTPLQKAEVKKQAKANAKISYPFWFGGSASCFAATCTHPLDLGMFVLLFFSVAGPFSFSLTVQTEC